MTRLLLVLLMLLLSDVTFAKIYKWVDAQGEVHYQDHPRGTPEKFYNGDNTGAAKQQDNHIITQQPKAMKESRPQKAERKTMDEQRKQAEQCNKIREQVNKLETRLKQDGKFAKENPASYLRQQKLLIQRRQYLDQHCH